MVGVVGAAGVVGVLMLPETVTGTLANFEESAAEFAKT